MRFLREWRVARLETTLQGLIEAYEKYRDPRDLREMRRLRAKRAELLEHPPCTTHHVAIWYDEKGRELVRQCYDCGDTVHAPHNATTLEDKS